MRRDTSVGGRTRSFDSRKRKSIHVCELLRGSDSNLLKLRPTASLRSRLKRAFQKTIIVTEKHPTTKFYLRSRAAIAFEKKRHGRSPNWWVIHPCSGARFAWSIVMSLTYLFCFVAIPYSSAFWMLNSGNYHSEESLLIPGYLICIVDIFLNFITGYTSTNSHEIFLDPEAIASHYVRGYFILDLLSSIPYSYILQNYHTVPDGENANFATIMAELLPLLKIARLTTFHQFLTQLMQVFSFGHIARLVIWFGILTAFFLHWSACLTYGFPFIVMHATKTRIEDSKAWFTNLPNITDPLRASVELYLSSFYTGLTGLCAIDSDILANETFQDRDLTGDRLVTCVLLVFGTVYQLYLMIHVLQLVELETAPETRYRQVTNDLEIYTREKQLPPVLEKKLLTFYEFRFQERCFKEDAIVGSLADYLKDEIKMHSCRKLMENVAIFWSLPKSQLASIISALKPEIFLTNDVVFKCNDEGKCMYFIGNGTLAIMTYTGKEICHLEDGAYFGESSLLFPGFRRPVTVIADEECELLRFDRKDFKRLIPVNSDLYKRMRKVVKDQVAILVHIENEELEHNKLDRSGSSIFINVSSREKQSSEDRR